MDHSFAQQKLLKEYQAKGAMRKNKSSAQILFLITVKGLVEAITHPKNLAFPKSEIKSFPRKLPLTQHPFQKQFGPSLILILIPEHQTVRLHSSQGVSS